MIAAVAAINYTFDVVTGGLVANSISDLDAMMGGKLDINLVNNPVNNSGLDLQIFKAAATSVNYKRSPSQ
eukprot:6475242-Amphidinium_carterae.1